jgi:hypothetical protein
MAIAIVCQPAVRRVYRGAVRDTCVNVGTCIYFPCYVRTRCYAEAHESDTAGSAHRSSGSSTLDPHKASGIGERVDRNQLVFAHTSGWRKYTFYEEHAQMKAHGEFRDETGPMAGTEGMHESSKVGEGAPVSERKNE